MYSSEQILVVNFSSFIKFAQQKELVAMYFVISLKSQLQSVFILTYLYKVNNFSNLSKANKI